MRNYKLNDFVMLIVMEISLYLAIYKNVGYVSLEDNKIWPYITIYIKYIRF